MKRERAESRGKCPKAAVSIRSSWTSVIPNTGREMKRGFYTAAPPKNTGLGLTRGLTVSVQGHVLGAALKETKYFWSLCSFILK